MQDGGSAKDGLDLFMESGVRVGVVQYAGAGDEGGQVIACLTFQAGNGLLGHGFESQQSLSEVTYIDGVRAFSYRTSLNRERARHLVARKSEDLRKFIGVEPRVLYGATFSCTASEDPL